MKGRQPAGAALPRPDVTHAIRAAVLRELAEGGYARVAMEAVARRAGVGKAAIYRRWPSKLALIGDILGDVLGQPHVPETAETLHEDLRGLMESFAALLGTPDLPAIMADLASEALRNQELSELITASVGNPFSLRTLEVVERAVARGELSADLDREAALDVAVSALYWRVVVRRRTLEAADLDRFATVVAAGLRAL
ncbi:TetR/AcrR family transcriptional regulator [Kineosporia succinea]|uniref:AcrR family transcriptional regulator n=1 Tax=Kineosporia succinea TaxID=84632 RepID=A0ABT9PA57_9ACTN|nr:TetR/AcrR family transcriptional regulator [Kineosporia succinea]MDP9829572.1 AcrR family transcriptional regulator [Kineosporia succinea]